MALLTLDNVVAFVLQAAVLAAVPTAVIPLLRIERPAFRYAVWRGVLILSLVLPAMQPLHVETLVVRATQLPAASAATTPTAVAAGTSMMATNWFLVVMGAGMAVRLIWLVVGAIRLRRVSKQGQDAASAAAHLQEALGTNAAVVYASGLEQPATCGLFRPVVLLPARLRSMDASVTRAVLVHELLHVKRRDWAHLVIEELVRTVLWFSPATWWVIDHVHAAREELVDARAAQLAGGRRVYVRALLEFADARTLSLTPAFAERRHLFTRISRLCKEPTMSSRHAVFGTLVLLACVAAGSTGAVGAFPLEGERDVLVAPALQQPPPPPPQPVQPPPPPPKAPAAKKPAPPPPPPPVRATAPAPPREVKTMPPVPPPPPPVPAIVRPPAAPVVQGPPPPPPPPPPQPREAPPAPPVPEARIVIAGDVKTPGEFVLKPGTTVAQAIALAGGFTDRARKDGVTLTRRVNGKERTRTVKDTDVLQPGDLLEVPRRFW